MVRVAEPLGSHIMLTGETAGQHLRVWFRQKLQYISA